MSVQPSPNPETVRLRQDWWAQWRRRFAEFFETGRTEFSAERIDVLAHAAEAMGSDALRLDLSHMTLGEWSNLLSRALSGPQITATPPVPLWMAVPAIHFLGFGARMPGLVRSVLPPQPSDPGSGSLHRDFAGFPTEMEQITSWSDLYASRFEQRSRPTAIILTGESNSIAAHWAPSERYAGLVWSGRSSEEVVPQWDEQAYLVLRRFGFSIFDSPSDQPWFDVLLAELRPSPEAEALIEQLTPQPRRSSGQKQLSKISPARRRSRGALTNDPLDALRDQNPQWFMAREGFLITARDSSTPDLGVPVIRGPSDFDDAMSRALRVVAP